MVPPGKNRSEHERVCYKRPDHDKARVDMRNGKKLPIPAGEHIDGSAPVLTKSTHPEERQIITVNIDLDLDARIYFYVPLLFPSRSEFVRAALLDQILHPEPVVEVPVKKAVVVTVELPVLTLAIANEGGNRSAYLRGLMGRFLDRLDKLLEERGRI